LKGFKKMDIDAKIELMVELALKKYGLLYRWGSKGPVHYDCSGMVSECCKSVGFLGADSCLDAQDIHKVLTTKGWEKVLRRGSLVFFGEDIKTITHVGIALDDSIYIGSSSGDHTTLNDDVAIKQNAYVKVRPMRHDLVDYLYPNR
jgi:cell wall-associated NlpC family hydrolase